MTKAKIFLLFCLCFIFGVAINSYLEISWVVNILIFFLGLFFLIFGFKNSKIRILALLVLFFLLGIIRYELSFPTLNENKIQFYHNQKITFQGLVKKVDQGMKRQELVVEGRQLMTKEGWKKISGKVLIFIPLYADYRYGDHLEISCFLKKPQPFDRFNYHEYLARYHIYSFCWPRQIKVLTRDQGYFLAAQILKIKERVKFSIDRNFTEPQGAILSAILLGLKKEILPEVRSWFTQTGTAHLLAISGLHITIFTNLLIIFGIVIFSLRRQNAFYFVLIVLIIFIFLIGWPASALRAGLMGLSGLLAEKLGRRQQSLNFLILAATVILLFNPKLLKADPGFQLSFMAMTGIITFSPYLWEKLKKIPERYQLRRMVVTTLSAYFFTLPLVLFYFGSLSLSAVLTNVLVLPTLPVLIGFSFIFALGSFIFLPLGQILFFPAWLCLTYLIIVIKTIAQIPFFSFNLGSIPWLTVLVFYLIIIYFFLKIRFKKQFLPKNEKN